MQILITAILLSGALSLLYFSFTSWKEKETRALLIGLFASFVWIILWSIPILIPDFQIPFLLFAGLIAGGLAIYWGLPLGRIERGNDTPEHRLDERDVIFARMNLKPGSQEFKDYYTMRPENAEPDRLTREKPGLLSADSKYADDILFASAHSSFAFCESVRSEVDGEINPEKQDFTPNRAAESIKSLARFYGAENVGLTERKPYHVYSHIGRGDGVYGEPITLNHSFAIAYTVEMDFEMISGAPLGAGVAESAKQYVEAARIGIQLASTLRRLGYEARAHIDGNYRVIAPLVARDAGLGEIGRMGLLMTPNLGPRVRLGVVTTNFPMNTDEPKSGTSVLDFCTICKKCADNCPVQAISFDPREEINGALRWKIDEVKCYRFWSVAGTDCGICMKVCPYSHPDNLAHNLVRTGIRFSGGFRRLALRMDDLFYGRKPKEKPAQDWTNLSRRLKE